MEIENTLKALSGGEFLIQASSTGQTFVPEEHTEEQEMIFQMAASFVEQEIKPNIDRIENQEPGMAEYLFRKSGELGLLGAHMPEAYGGMNLDFNTNTLLCDALGNMGSFNTSFAAHTGIGMLPILYYGTDAQKEKYLPRMIDGSIKASYCLTEPGSGSDALAAKTRADLSPDGKQYIINGQKMWISNAGFADLFVVFAKINGEHFTGFLIERGTPGLTFGEEEKKLGIKGSSTRQVFFENVAIPVENQLGEVGKGHLIALNVLNMGRFKLGAFCIGGAKSAITESIRYANERIQFGKPIGNFGAIQYKLAEQTIRSFTAESLIYRISDLIQRKTESLIEEGVNPVRAKQKAAQEYAIECSIAKIVGSEMIDFVVDEYVQVLGGIGYSEEHAAARAYRDARINRIYEGTNEINRLVIVDMVFRKALKGELDLVNAAWAVQKELAKMPTLPGNNANPYAAEELAIENMRKLVLMVIGAAGKMQMDGQLDLKNEQEITMNGADMIIELFAAESLLLRVRKLDELNKKEAFHDDVLKVQFWEASQRIAKTAREAINSFVSGDLQRTFLMGVKRFDQYPAVNVKDARRRIAQHLLTANEYRM